MGHHMQGWLDEVAGSGYSQALLWALLALLVLVVLLVIIKLIRSMTFGTFVAGGRNRKNRLAVMDATAVDSHRRLVLVRRDDTEHLLLIGGATDIVVESDIRLGQRKPAVVPPEAAREIQQPLPQPPQVAAVQQAPVTQIQQGPVPSRRTSDPGRSAPAVVPPPRAPIAVARSEAPRPAQSTTTRSAAFQPSPPRPSMPVANSDELDDALLRELQVSLDDDGARPQPAAPGQSLDDEMAKLLGELSNPRR
jgi:hypothetical protein